MFLLSWCTTFKQEHYNCKAIKEINKTQNRHDKFSAQHKYVEPISLKFSTCSIEYFVHIIICVSESQEWSQKLATLAVL
jgi:hypothetical protein